MLMVYFSRTSNLNHLNGSGTVAALLLSGYAVKNLVTHSFIYGLQYRTAKKHRFAQRGSFKIPGGVGVCIENGLWCDKRQYVRNRAR